VFRPVNLTHLDPGRLTDMVADAQSDEPAIICDATPDEDGIGNAVYRDFYDWHLTRPLQIAERLGVEIACAARGWRPSTRWPTRSACTPRR